MANLMSFSPNLHLPYQTYLKKLEAAQNQGDMFSGLLGSDSSASTSNVIESNTNDLDLSWLDNI